MEARKKILIVDDEPDYRSLLAMRLLANGFTVLEAGDGPSGIELTRKERPDLILLDIILPGEDGIKTYQVLKEDPATKDTPVIFLTAMTPASPPDKDSVALMAYAKHGVGLEGDYTVVSKIERSEVFLKKIRQTLGEPVS